MKNKIEQIKNSWTWNHKTAIIAIALAVSHLWQFVPAMPTNVIEYEKPPKIDTSIEYKLQQRAKELHKENEAMDLERYRLEAIRELNNSLLDMMNESPFINYDEMVQTYGY
jgi:hypothetical protein